MLGYFNSLATFKTKAIALKITINVASAPSQPKLTPVRMLKATIARQPKKMAAQTESWFLLSRTINKL